MVLKQKVISFLEPMEFTLKSEIRFLKLEISEMPGKNVGVA